MAKHLTAETKTEEFVAGRGVVTKWECVRRQNHWFDALYNACAAGHLGGVRLVVEPEPVQSRPTEQVSCCDGQPWFEEWKQRFVA